MREIALGKTIEIPFAANDDQGNGDDGSSPLFDVRLEGAAASAAPVFSGTPSLLTDAGYAPGGYVCIIAATAVNGFAWNGVYHVYATITVPTAKTPHASLDSFAITPAAAIRDTIVHGVISDAISGPTIANFRTTVIVDVQLNLYKGRLIGIVSSGSGLFKAYTRIKSYQLTSGEGDFTVEDLPIAPAAGDIVVAF